MPYLIPDPSYIIPDICDKIMTVATYTSRIYTMIIINTRISNMVISCLLKYKYYRLPIKEHHDPGKMASIRNTFSIINLLKLVLSHI